ncbi:SpaA isopeptide-forming pilin-related protein [uncultured Clostridium sp.]|uniref:SpaA isopeptide-forming pilin-related protein n=1 Tax=uncultured Clostridium sp. TaxID=59620 RepID=UPI00272B0869|nr:SpaA isopeptide-forming pilin-related protein [uncultured Clostridium sp.]
MLKAKKLKKVIALMFIAITLLSTAQPIFAVTDSGSGKWTAGQWDSNIYTTDNKSDLGMLMRRLVNTTTGEKITVFCAEHGVNSQTGTVETGTHNTPTDPKVKRACKVAFFGWYQKYGNYCIDGGIMAADMNSRKMDYVFTQQMVWSTLGQSNATFRNASIQSQYEAFKADINAKIDNMERKPSFCSETITVEVGQTKTLTDSNNVLGQYVSFDKTVDGIRITHNKGENTLNVTANEDCTKEAIRISENTMFDWGVIKEETHNQHSTVYFTFRDGVQNQLYSLNYNDPVTMSLSFKINLLGNLELSKLNTNGDLVDGAIFNVTGENGFNRDVTVTNGKIKLEKLRKGTYYIKEKSSPTGYLLNTETYTAEVKPNQTTEQAIVNTEPTAEITVTKTNTNGDKVQGAKFQIIANEDIYNVARTVKHHSKGDVVATITTNSVGVASKSNLPLGKYKIKEIEVPTGYLLNTEQKEVTLRYKDQNTNVIFGSVTVENTEPTGNLIIEKTDKETGNKNRVDKKSHHGDATLKGTEYTLYAKERITNVAGTIKYFDKDEQIATFTFNEYGVASIKITNNNTPAKISVEGTKLTGLPMGKYYAKETIVPTGYMPDTKVYDYTFSYRDMNTKVIEVAGTVTNTVEKAPFEVIKVSTNENATAETVANAEFTAILSKYVDYYGSFDEAKKHLSEFATDEYSIFRTGTNGHGISGLLAYGEYTVNETYTPSPEITTVEQFYVTIDKDSKTPVKELVENDLPFEAYIKMQKQDKKTGKFVTYSNATFELYRLNEDTNKWEQVQCKISDKYYKTWTTNSEGVAKTETKLEAGKYKLTEIKIPTGFIQLDEELTFKVDNRNSTLNYDKDWDAWITVTVKNEQPTGTLKLNKKVALREDMDKTMIKDIDFTKISFELVADEKIIDYADGSTIYEKGKVVGKYNLKADGTLTVSNLPMGKYHLKELTTIDGAVLDKTEYEVIFEQKDTVTKEYVVEKDIENRTTAIEVSKTDITGEKELVGAKLTITDENNEVIDSWVSTEKTHKIEGLVVGKEYTLKEETAPNGFVVATEIKFKVENTAEIQKVTMIDKVVTMTKQDIGGNEIEGAELQVIDEDNNVVDEWTSTKEPHRINNLVEGKTYTLIEQYAPDGFVISNEVKFTVTTDKETQEVKMIDKVVEISKQDISGNELEGATLVVTSTKTKNIVDKWVSGKEPHKVNGLIENEEYILHEEIVVDGYVKATDVKFTVTSDKETQKVIIIDKILEVVKTDLVTGEEIEGAELKVIDEDGNVIDEWTSTKEPHKVVGLEENKKYKLVEITAPYGYEITEEIEFTVSEDKETQRVEMKDMPILQNIKLVKIDSNTKEVIKDKFTFGIYEDAECTKLIKEVKSDKENGTVLFEDLRYGTYYIKEIAAPKGYVLSDKVIKVEMNDKGIFIDNEKVESEDSTYTFEFENVPVDTPKTGDNSNLKLYAGLLGLSILALASVGVHEYKKRKSVNKK